MEINTITPAKATIRAIKVLKESINNEQHGRWLQCNVTSHRQGNVYLILVQEWGTSTPSQSPSSSPRASPARKSSMRSPLSPKRSRDKKSMETSPKSASPGSSTGPDLETKLKKTFPATTNTSTLEDLWNNTGDTTYTHRVTLKGTLSSLRSNGGLEHNFVIPQDIDLLPHRMYLFRVLCQSSLGGSDQKVFEAMGDTLCRTLPGPPGAPKNVELVDATSNTLRLKWVSGIRNGSQPQTYRVQRKLSKDTVWIENSSMNSTAFNINGLSPGQNYMFRICTESDIGTSPWSVVYNFQTRNAPPLPPGPGTFVSATNETIRIQWKIPPIPLSISSTQPYIFVVEARQISSKLENVNNMSKRPYQIVYRGDGTQANLCGFLPSTSYAFRIYATSATSKKKFYFFFSCQFNFWKKTKY